MKTRKSAIIMSAVAILLCVAMLAGSTFAWFTDNVTSAGNIITAGNLDVEMHWTDDLTTNQWTDASTGAIFNYKKWEPGYTEVKYIKVSNKGSLNLKWKLTVEANGQVTKLTDVIDVYYVNPISSNITTLDGLTSVGTLTNVIADKTNSTGALTKNQEVIVAIAFHMDEQAGNEYQDLLLCDNGFSVKLVAAQDVGESDSFGDDYDADAAWGAGSVSFVASTAIEPTNLLHGALASDVTVGAAGGINAIVPADVKIEDGATKLGLSVNAVDVDSNITLGDGEFAKTYDVHISGVAEDNVVPMTINLGNILEAGLKNEQVKLYHTEDGVANTMTRVASVADFAIHNQFTYDEATGEVVIYIKSFSFITAAAENVSLWEGASDTTWYDDNANEFVLTNAAQFVGFRDLVDAGKTFVGKTVKLGINIDLDGHLFDPIGFGYADNGGQAFMGTFDGQNHTIFNLYQNGWDLDPDKTNYSTYTYSTAGGGLFASVKDATIKNLTVSGAEIVFECVDMGIVAGYAQGQCTFENIIVTDSKIANYQRYTGGIVGEVCKGDLSKEYTHVFQNIVVDSNVTISSLWGDFDNSCGGVIGGKWGNAKVLMENIKVACKIDAFSDVTAAYQWYAYRRCGMLIGNTEESAADNAHLAAATFLTCDNVEVYYGDWTAYKYCLFTNQDNSWCNNYPWVRVQKGEHNSALSNPRYGVPVINGESVAVGHDAEFHQDSETHELIIEFKQLYGGGQGVYGCANHNGVTSYELGSTKSKTIYIKNNEGWTDLSLKYWCRHDTNGDEWTTVSEEGIDITGTMTNTGVYKIELPYYAYSIQIIGDGENKTELAFVANLAGGKTYTLDWNEYNFSGSVDGGDFS